MTQEKLWQDNYNAYMNYMKRYRQRPSKYDPKLAKMVNWMKYNKKLLAAGRMSAERAVQFRYLLEVAEKYRMVNQHSYVHTTEEQWLML
ncbi:MAG: hypothetical protein IJ196_08360 [Prevotella sp.]|nr:hypothetical protein [Prevotella sp.]